MNSIKVYIISLRFSVQIPWISKNVSAFSTCSSHDQKQFVLINSDKGDSCKWNGSVRKKKLYDFRYGKVNWEEMFFFHLYFDVAGSYDSEIMLYIL